MQNGFTRSYPIYNYMGLSCIQRAMSRYWRHHLQFLITKTNVGIKIVGAERDITKIKRTDGS